MSKVTILTDIPGDVIHGTTDFTAARFLGVVLDPENAGALKKATNVRRAYHLERDIVEEVELRHHVFMPEIVTPTKKGNEITARRARLIEVEGSDHLVESGTGSLSAATSAGDTKLEWFEGKLRVRQGSNEIAGRVVSQETAQEEGNAFRLKVELFD